MITKAQVISCQDLESPLPDLDLAQEEITFLLAKTRRDLNLQWLHSHPALLSHLVATIARQPKNLLTHLQRIYLCYQQDLPEQLYGALTDFFIVLNRRSLKFSSRILAAVSSKLPEQQYQLLRNYLLQKDSPPQQLPSNAFTVLGKGFIGTSKLVTQLQEMAKQEQQHDPLLLARDCIEYSQLPEAIAILENAILETPDREELHTELLDLYKSLRDFESFSRMQQQLEAIGNPFESLWEETHMFFGHK